MNSLWNRMREESTAYLVSSRRYIYFATTAFLFFCIVGYVFSSYLSFLDEFIRNLVSRVSALHGLDLGLFIFANNLQSAFVGMILGAFFGLVPIFNIILNGTVLGYVIAVVSTKSNFLDIWKLLPHGIFELPAIFISLGLGLKLGMFIFTRKPFKTLRERLYCSMLVFLFYVLPLLAIAAIIEGAFIEFYE